MYIFRFKNNRNLLTFSNWLARALSKFEILILEMEHSGGWKIGRKCTHILRVVHGKMGRPDISRSPEADGFRSCLILVPTGRNAGMRIRCDLKRQAKKYLIRLHKGSQGKLHVEFSVEMWYDFNFLFQFSGQSFSAQDNLSTQRYRVVSSHSFIATSLLLVHVVRFDVWDYYVKSMKWCICIHPPTQTTAHPN